MLGSPREQIFALALLLTCALAVWRGGRPERIGAAAMFAAACASILLQDRRNWIDPQYVWIPIDIGLLGVLAYLATTSERRWVVVAGACQVLMVGVHVGMMIDLRLRSVAYITSIGLLSDVIVLSLAAGIIFEAMPQRRRLRAGDATG